jgi:hypothetical protein
MTTSTYKLSTLAEIADEAAMVLECKYDYGSSKFTRDPSDTDLGLIEHLYLSCWTNHFADAMYPLTAWPIVRLSSNNKRFIRFFNRADSGRLVAVTGYVTLDDLKTVYKDADLWVTDDVPRDTTAMDLDDMESSMTVEALLHLDYPPFIDLKPKVMVWLNEAGKEDRLVKLRAMLEMDEEDTPREPLPPVYWHALILALMMVVAFWAVTYYSRLPQS